MARPTKAAKTTVGKFGKKNINERINEENRIKGDRNEIQPADYLNEEQREIFFFIKEQLEAAEILGNLDVFILTQAAVSIERLAKIEGMINKSEALLFDGKFMASKDKYTKDFFRCCNELSLSPQSRAKLANQFVQSKKDPLLEALANHDNDD